MLEIKIIETD